MNLIKSTFTVWVDEEGRGRGNVRKGRAKEETGLKGRVEEEVKVKKGRAKEEIGFNGKVEEEG